MIDQEENAFLNPQPEPIFDMNKKCDQIEICEHELYVVIFLQAGPFDFYSPSLTTFHQQVWLLTSIRVINPSGKYRLFSND